MFSSGFPQASIKIMHRSFSLIFLTVSMSKWLQLCFSFLIWKLGIMTLSSEALLRGEWGRTRGACAWRPWNQLPVCSHRALAIACQYWFGLLSPLDTWVTSPFPFSIPVIHLTLPSTRMVCQLRRGGKEEFPLIKQFKAHRNFCSQGSASRIAPSPSPSLSSMSFSPVSES